MENNKYSYTDELKDLGLENLESVSGGIRKVTPEEYQRFLELRDEFDRAKAAYESGTGTKEELDIAREAMLSHVRSS